MIPRPTPERFRLRRTMMFMNAQKPGLIKDAYIYGVDSIMLDLEDAVAENQKDAARFSLYHALRTVDYRGVERVVRINGEKVCEPDLDQDKTDPYQSCVAEVCHLRAKVCELEKILEELKNGIPMAEINEDEE